MKGEIPSVLLFSKPHVNCKKYNDLNVKIVFFILIKTSQFNYFLFEPRSKILIINRKERAAFLNFLNSNNSNSVKILIGGTIKFH